MSTTTCTGCGTEVEPLDLFPRNRCLACHAEEGPLRPPMTADKLAKMFGAK